MRKQMIEATEEIKALSLKAYNYYKGLSDYKVYRIGKQYYTLDPNGFYPVYFGGLEGIVKELEWVSEMKTAYCVNKVA